MTRADHPSGSDRIFEALGKLDPDGESEIVVNLQGDFPTIRRKISASVLAPLDDPAVDIATLAAEIHTEEESTAPSVVKAVGSPIGPAAAARALFHPRHRALGRRTALSPYRPLRLSPRGAGALRQPAALAAGAAGEARAVAGAGGRHADRHHHRRHRAARRRHAGRPRNRPPDTGKSLSGCYKAPMTKRPNRKSRSRASRAPIPTSPSSRPIPTPSRCPARPSRTRWPRSPRGKPISA